MPQVDLAEGTRVPKYPTVSVLPETTTWYKQLL